MTPSTEQFTDAPIFDADQHMYETPEALLKFLPDKYKSKVQFVQIGRHTRIAILNKITDYMPNPTFERVAAPGAHERFYSGQNPDGLTMREMSGRGIDAPPASRNRRSSLPCATPGSATSSARRSSVSRASPTRSS